MASEAAKSASEPATFDERQLEVYLTCPRKYFYEFVLGLNGKRDEAVYLQFHHCVYNVLRWVKAERAAGKDVSDEAALAYLDEVWQAKGPGSHHYELIYRARAGEMVRNALRRVPPAHTTQVDTNYEISLTHGRVRLSADHAELVHGDAGPELRLQRFRTGKPTKKEGEKPIYSLYHKAASQAHPHARRVLQILYLSSNETIDVELTERQLESRISEYDQAIDDILHGRFEPNPSDHECPRCPHFFICPVAE